MPPPNDPASLKDGIEGSICERGAKDRAEERDDDPASNDEVLENPKKWLALSQEKKSDSVKGKMTKLQRKIVSAASRRDQVVHG